jgi:hypothetical protein
MQDSPLPPPFLAKTSTCEDDESFRSMMSAHEAGHAAVGMILGARVEAVYAAVVTRLPNGNFRLVYLTKFGSLAKRGLGLKEQILLTAGGAAGEILLNGKSDNENIVRDKADLKAVGFTNFDYCVDHAIQLLGPNLTLLSSLRDRIKASLSNLKKCKLTKRCTHIILAKGSEIEKLFAALGTRTNPSNFSVEAAR